MTEHGSRAKLLSAAEPWVSQFWVVNIPESIRQGRKRRKLSQRDLAKLLKVAPSAVAQWEGGETEPSIGNRIALSVQLDISILELLPEGAALGEVVIKDPKEVFLVERFRLIPERLRETYLQLILAQTENETALSDRSPQAD